MWLCVSVCVLEDDGPIDYNVCEKVKGTMSWQLVILGTNHKSDVGVYDSVGFIRYPKDNNCFFFYQETSKGDSSQYNEVIQHETLRVAVCDMLEGAQKCPPVLRCVGMLIHVL